MGGWAGRNEKGTAFWRITSWIPRDTRDIGDAATRPSEPRHVRDRKNLRIDDRLMVSSPRSRTRRTPRAPAPELVALPLDSAVRAADGRVVPYRGDDRGDDQDADYGTITDSAMCCEQHVIPPSRELCSVTRSEPCQAARPSRPWRSSKTDGPQLHIRPVRSRTPVARAITSTCLDAPLCRPRHATCASGDAP